jgi:hypothetical protein
MRIVNLRAIGGFDGLKEMSGRYVGRGSVLGNRFVIGRDGSREEVIEKYRRWLFDELVRGTWKVQKELEMLVADSVIGCWCFPKRCHGEVIERCWGWWVWGGGREKYGIHNR